MNGEKLLTLPLEAARMVGVGVLWVTDRFVPPKPTVETKAASITYYTTEVQDEHAGG